MLPDRTIKIRRFSAKEVGVFTEAHEINFKVVNLLKQVNQVEQLPFYLLEIFRFVFSSRTVPRPPAAISYCNLCSLPSKQQPELVEGP